jgi:hypothetical protein
MESLEYTGFDEEENKENELVNGTKSEVDYYRIVRTTLHGLDGVRLNASVSGLTICSVFLGLSFTTQKYVDNICIMNYDIPLPLLLAYFSCFLAALNGIQFILKVQMFSNFIKSCVEIAKDFEKKLVNQEEHRLTFQFEKYTYAGSRGDNLFKLSLFLMVITSIIGMLMSFILLIVDDLLIGVFVIVISIVLAILMVDYNFINIKILQELLPIKLDKK